MKKVFPYLLTLVLASLLLLGVYSPTPLGQGFVELPDETKGTVTVLVVAVVGLAITKLITLVPFLAFLKDFEAPLGMALSSALIEALQNMLPSAYPEVSILAVQLILAILAALKLFEILKARGARFFQ